MNKPTPDASAAAGSTLAAGSACTSRWGHSWRKRHDLNSGFYHHGALARTGEMCERCAAVRFHQTDDEYFAKLPEWLKNDPELLRPNNGHDQRAASGQPSPSHD